MFSVAVRLLGDHRVYYLCLCVLVPEAKSHCFLDVHFINLPVCSILSCTEGKPPQLLTFSTGFLYHTLLPKQNVVVSFPSAEHPLGSSVHDVLEGQT